jgi:hypothetical protein
MLTPHTARRFEEAFVYEELIKEYPSSTTDGLSWFDRGTTRRSRNSTKALTGYEPKTSDLPEYLQPACIAAYFGKDCRCFAKGEFR